MHIRDKIRMDQAQLEKEGPITIVAFGDSITHGSFATNGTGYSEKDYESVYWNRLRKKILDVRDYVPVNVINAGIGGTTAARSMARLEKQVLIHNPDLVIVCFGLNDTGGGLEKYLSALRVIFERCSAVADVIFMTPNMMNTYIADDVHPAEQKVAEHTMRIQNSGTLDLFMNAAVNLAGEMHIPVCDCYAKWKELSLTQDTTKMLVNRINHPTKEMHELFAESLFRMIFDESSEQLTKEACVEPVEQPQKGDTAT